MLMVFLLLNVLFGIVNLYVAYDLYPNPWMLFNGTIGVLNLCMALFVWYTKRRLK